MTSRGPAGRSPFSPPGCHPASESPATSHVRSVVGAKELIIPLYPFDEIYQENKANLRVIQGKDFNLGSLQVTSWTVQGVQSIYRERGNV